MSATAFQRKRRALETQKSEEEKQNQQIEALQKPSTEGEQRPTENQEPEHLKDMKVPELKAHAKTLGITGVSSMNRDDLIQVIMEVEGRDGGGSESTFEDQE